MIGRLSKNVVHRIRVQLERRLNETSIVVALMSAGGGELSRRRDIKTSLESEDMVVLIPEDDFPPDIAPSLAEKAMLSKGDIDLAFLNVESWDSATEFGQLHGSTRIARKLRVLVKNEYHPLYGTSTSYLTDLYLTHTAVYGHVHAYGDNSTPFPSAKQAILKLAKRL